MQLRHPFLPALTPDREPGPPDVAGAWREHRREALLPLVSDGIVVDEQAKVRGVSSVPDIWARPLTFASALTQRSHPLHEALIDEWRGLLSLIALARADEKHGDRLRLQAVDVNIDGRFTAPLRRLAPDPVRLEAPPTRPYDWTRVVLIQYGDVAIGALSPRTLVYTATDYARAIAGFGLHLTDPTTGRLAARLNREECEYVAEWVAGLRNRLGSVLCVDEQANRDYQAAATIKRLLDDWEADLRRALGKGREDRLDAPGVEVDTEPLTIQGGGHQVLADHRVYYELLKPLKKVESPKTELELTAGRNLSDVRTVVVVTPDLIASDAKIWDMKRLSSLNANNDSAEALAKHFDAESGTHLDGARMMPHGAMWIRPDRYFLTDVLLRATGDDLFVHPSADPEPRAEGIGRMNGSGRFLMPFKRTILNFFSPEQVRELLSPEFVRETNDAVTFRFSLPVGDAQARVERTYRLKDAAGDEGTLRDVEPPEVDIFPKYLGHDWRKYFVFQDRADVYLVAPVVLGDDARSVSREHKDAATGDRIRITATVADAVRLDDRVDRLPFPEALEFRTSGAKSAPLGLLLLPRPEEPVGRAGCWRIGIDFGTSNSNVYYRAAPAPGGRAEDVIESANRWSFRFPDYLFRATGVRPERRRNESYFLPSRPIEFPVPTILRIHVDAEQRHALLDHLIHLSDDFVLPANAYAHIKWDDAPSAPGARRKTALFLENLLLLILVDVFDRRLESVQFACSYPKVFSAEQRKMFEGEWKIVIENLLGPGPDRVGNLRIRSGLDRPSGEGLGEPAYEFEGIAAGRFFASAKALPRNARVAPVQHAAVCLDVGGGTTDISVWFANTITFDASIRLAGSEISELLRRRPRLLEALVPQAAQGLQEHRDDRVRFGAALNIVLRQHEKPIQERLNQLTNSRDVRALRQLLAVEFGAIAFYATAVLAATDSLTQGELLTRLSGHGVQLHWGGNAAKFINWIDLGVYSSDGIAANVFNALVYNGLKEMMGVAAPDDRLGQFQSPTHKSEVAGGLVVMDLGQRAVSQSAPTTSRFERSVPPNHETGMVMGEDVLLKDGRTISATEMVTEHDFFDGQRTLLQRPTLKYLELFVDNLNHFGSQFGLFGRESKIDFVKYRSTIEDQVGGWFIEAQTQKAGTRRFEPVFVMGARVLLNLLSEDIL